MLQLSTSGPGGLRLSALQLTLDGRAAVYGMGVPRQGGDACLASIHVTALDTPNGRMLVDGSGISGFLVTLDGRSLLYTADRDANGFDESYVVAVGNH